MKISDVKKEFSELAKNIVHHKNTALASPRAVIAITATVAVSTCIVSGVSPTDILDPNIVWNSVVWDTSIHSCHPCATTLANPPVHEMFPYYGHNTEWQIGGGSLFNVDPNILHRGGFIGMDPNPLIKTGNPYVIMMPSAAAAMVEEPVLPILSKIAGALAKLKP